MDKVLIILLAGLVAVLISYVDEALRENRRLKKKPEKKIDLRKTKTASKLKKFMQHRVGMLRRYIENLNSVERNKSLVYKYYSMMNNVIISLNLASSTNPESMLILIAVASLVISAVLCQGMGMILFSLFYVGVVAVIHSLLHYFSRTETLNRLFAIMDAEDLLGSNMERGIVIAITENINAINPKIQPIFNDFLFNLSGTNMDINKAIRLMNISLGPQMDSFCENSLLFYNDGDISKLNKFRAQIRKNSKRRIALRERQERFKSNMVLYIACIAITLMFGICSISLVGEPLEYLASYHGRLCTLISLISGFFGFALSQMTFAGGID